MQACTRFHESTEHLPQIIRGGPERLHGGEDIGANSYRWSQSVAEGIVGENIPDRQ